VRLDLNKVQVIKKWQSLTIVEGVKSFLGLQECYLWTCEHELGRTFQNRFHSWNKNILKQMLPMWHNNPWHIKIFYHMSIFSNIIFKYFPCHILCFTFEFIWKNPHVCFVHIIGNLNLICHSSNWNYKKQQWQMSITTRNVEAIKVSYWCINSMVGFSKTCWLLKSYVIIQIYYGCSNIFDVNFHSFQQKVIFQW